MKKNKISISVALSLFLLFFIHCQVCFGAITPSISIEPQYQNVSVGDVFTVNITVDPGDEAIFAAQYDLFFDTALLKAISQEQGVFLGQDGVATMVYPNITNNTCGTIEYGETRMGNPSEVGGVTIPGVLASITYETIAPGVSYLNLSNTKTKVIVIDENSSYGDLFPDINNGICEIMAVEQTPTPTPTPSSGGGGTSVTPASTPTLPPLPSGAGDNSTGETTVTPAQTPDPTSTPATTTPMASPSLTPVTTAYVPQSKENEVLPGFESAFAILILLASSYIILRRRAREEK